MEDKDIREALGRIMSALLNIQQFTNKSSESWIKEHNIKQFNNQIVQLDAILSKYPLMKYKKQETYLSVDDLTEGDKFYAEVKGFPMSAAGDKEFLVTKNLLSKLVAQSTRGNIYPLEDLSKIKKKVDKQA